jgi:hypothetical protein
MRIKLQFPTNTIDKYPTPASKYSHRHTCATGSFPEKTSTRSKSSVMPSKKKKNKGKLKRRLEEVAPLYTEDLGTQGIKKNSLASSAAGRLGSISKKPLAKDEESRRQERMVR